MRTIYRPDDLQYLKAVGLSAQYKWDYLANKYMKEKHSGSLGMWGSCVVGEGFCVDFIPKGKRKPIVLFICTAFGAACCGSLPWEACKDEIHYFIKECNVDAYFTYGRLD